jgi:hypothetical protein
MIYRRCMMAVACVVVLAQAGDAASLDGKSLKLLLLRAQDNNTPQTLLRADVEIEVATHDGRKATQAIALFAPGKDARWYLQLRQPALAALVLGTERKVMQRLGDKTETLPIGTTIDDLAIAYEDLSRFVQSDFKLWQITDEGQDKVLVGGFADTVSAYLYRAYTFDKERAVPLKTQFYADSLNNLVKLRLDDDYTLVGKKWLPGKIEIQNFPESATVKLHLRWSQAASAPPELLAPTSFAAAPPLPWPAASAPSPGKTP